MISVVIATYNRGERLARLLAQLTAQEGAPEFELIVVDDGSTPPASIPAGVRATLLRQENAGAAAARHAGIERARGELIVITDDDMQVPPHFLAAHQARHAREGRVAVLGEIRPDPDLARMPLFERFHADSLARQADARARGEATLHGNHLCTGNVSFRRADYVAVGGFDRTLERSEDAELGLRLELAGVKLVFDREAYVVHGSDHTSLPVWLGRAQRYGRYDQRIFDKHPGVAHANPWRVLFANAAAKAPFVAVALAVPAAADPLARGLMGLGALASKLGLETAGLRAAGVAFGVEYAAGLRREAGSLGESLRRARAYRAAARGTIDR